MTTYEDVRHAALEWQRQMRAVEVARRALIDATARAEAAWQTFADGHRCREACLSQQCQTTSRARR